MARFTGPVRKRLRGDVVRASKHVNLARTLLGLLVERMARSRLKQGKWKRKVREGVEITVSSVYGINEIAITAISGEQEEVLEFYMDSGYLKLINFNINPVAGFVVTEPPLYQNTLTTSLYSNITTSALELMPVANPVGEEIGFTPNGDVPPSYKLNPAAGGDDLEDLWSKVVNYTRVTQSPGNSTSRLKLHHQSKLGRLLTQNVGPSIVQPGYLGNTQGVGIYEDDDLNSWLVQFGYNGSEETLVGGATMLGGAVFADYKRAVNDPGSNYDERLQILSYAYAYSNTTNTTVTFSIPVGVSGGIKGGPLMYGWKFNWKGDKAAIVTNSPLGSPSFKSESQLLEFSLSITPDPIVAGRFNFSGSVALLDSGLWTPVQDILQVYVPMLGGGYCLYPGWYENRGGADFSSSPIYCWYESDSADISVDSLTVVRVSGAQPSSYVSSTCGGAGGNFWEGGEAGSVLTRFNNREATVSIGGTSETIEGSSVAGLITQVQGVGETGSQEQSVAQTTLNIFSRATSCDTPCTLTHELSSNQTNGIRGNVIIKFFTYTLHRLILSGVDNSTLQGFSVVPTFGCAEGVALLKRDGLVVNDATFSDRIYNQAIGERKYTLHSSDWNEGSNGEYTDDCVTDGTPSIGGSGPENSITTSYSAKYFNKYTTVSEGSLDGASWWGRTQADPCTFGTASIFQGLHPPSASIAGQDYVYGSDFPSEAEVFGIIPIGWA